MLTAGSRPKVLKVSRPSDLQTKMARESRDVSRRFFKFSRSSKSNSHPLSLVHAIDRRLHLVLLLEQAHPPEHPPHHSSHFLGARLGFFRDGRDFREARERIGHLV